MNLQRDDAPKEEEKEGPVIGRTLEEAYAMKAEEPLGASPGWRLYLAQWAKDRLGGVDTQHSLLEAEDALSYARVIPGISTTDLAALRAAYIEGLVWNGVGVSLGLRETDAEGKPVDSPEVGEKAKELVLAALTKLAAA